MRPCAVRCCSIRSTSCAWHACSCTRWFLRGGCELICDYLDFAPEDFFSWNYDFEDMGELCSAGEIDAGSHPVRELPPRFDFFKKHPSQL